MHARAKRSSNLVGGAKTLDKKDAEQRLQASLDKLAAGDGPNYRLNSTYIHLYKYNILKIMYVTLQDFEGLFCHLTGGFRHIDQNRC